MENTITENKIRLKDAVRQLRSGDIEGGAETLQRVEGQDILRNVAMAEVEHYRHNYKNAMYMDEHSLTSDSKWHNPFVVPHHLRAYVIAAKATGSISRAKEFLDYYIARKRDEYDNNAIRPFKSIYQNAMRRLDNQEAKDEPAPVKIISKEEAECEFRLYVKNGSSEPSPEVAPGAEVMLNFMWNHASTDSVLDFYEQYAEFITMSDHHLWAARNYIKLNDKEMAEKCIMRFVNTWTPNEKFQVLPMKIFVFNDILDFVSPELWNTIMTTPKGGNKE